MAVGSIVLQDIDVITIQIRRFGSRAFILLEAVALTELMESARLLWVLAGDIIMTDEIYSEWLMLMSQREEDELAADVTWLLQVTLLMLLAGSENSGGELNFDISGEMLKGETEADDGCGNKVMVVVGSNMESKCALHWALDDTVRSICFPKFVLESVTMNESIHH
ncbi:hypothetical protein Tco_0850250 [Tanacetum coccineum]